MRNRPILPGLICLSSDKLMSMAEVWKGKWHVSSARSPLPLVMPYRLAVRMVIHRPSHWRTHPGRV